MYLLRVTESHSKSIMAESQQLHNEWNSDSSRAAKCGNFKLQFIHNMEDTLWQELSSHQLNMYHKGRGRAEANLLAAQ